MKTENISESVIKDACNVVCSLCRLNAKYAVAYGFIVDKKNKEISRGEYVYLDELNRMNKGLEPMNFDGLLFLVDIPVFNVRKNYLLDVVSGREINVIKYLH